MRSSKSRSRNKSNRQRSLGNIVNRVFDSSGPEGKVRGTPQQIIDKYLMLARDAQLSNDRVAEQSFFQHAEHYTRMLGEAQREMAERQQQHNQNHNQRQNGDDDRDGNGDSRDNGGRENQQRDQSHRDGGQRDGGHREGGQRDQGRDGSGRDAHQASRDRSEREQGTDTDDKPADVQTSADPAQKPRRGRPRREAEVDRSEARSDGLPDAVSSETEDGPVATPEAGGERTAVVKAPRARAPRSASGAAPRSRRKPADEGAAAASGGNDAGPAADESA